MNKKIFAGITAILMLLGISATASAALTVIGTATYNGSDYNLIYDDGMNITWLDYTNDAATWADQVAWAESLNTDGVLTITLNDGVEMNWTGEWRLPDTVDGAWSYGYDGSGTYTGGYNITSSEMGYLYYEALGNDGYRDTSGTIQWPLTYNSGDFENLIFDMYWSGTAYSASSGYAWSFDFETGMQGRNSGSLSEYYGIAVINSSMVPIPGAVWLLGSGMLCLVGLRRRRK